VSGKNDCTRSRNIAWPLSDVALFTDVGMMVTNHNCMHEEIEEQIKLRECLLPLNTESSVFPFTIQE
jgi:hypothetical protein